MRQSGIYLKSPNPAEYVILFIMKVSAIGEFGLIGRLDRMIAAAGVGSAKDLLIGIGDDCAAWKCSRKIQLATVDSMVQDVHFTNATSTWREIGYKALAINLSDIAAMGGVPGYALINLALPQDTDADDMFQLYEGIIGLAKETGTAIVGGNISGADKISITVTIIGESLNGEILKRASSKPGDAIAITGWPGSAAAGLSMLMNGLKFDIESANYFRNAFLHPTPRLKEGQLLVKNGVKCAIDTSDGLLADLKHICEASGVGAHINAADIPIHGLLKKNFKEKALEVALSGGEDYELLFTASPEIVETVKKKLKVPANIIGEIKSGNPGEIRVVDNRGKTINPKKIGWTHF